MAYTTATVIEGYQEGDGRTHLKIRYTGDAGEPPVVKDLYIDTASAPGASYVRGVAMQQIAMLNTNRTALTSITLPFTLDVTTPITPPAAQVQTAYMSASTPFTPGATPQDVFTLTGSATKSVFVVGAGIATVQTTAGVNAWQLVRRSTANSAGTSATVNIVPTESAFTAASAVVRQYTVNPTAGTLVGSVWSGRVASSAPATAGVGSPSVGLTFGFPSIKLVGTGEVLAWNFNGVALPAGLSVSAYFVWTEV